MTEHPFSHSWKNEAFVDSLEDEVDDFDEVNDPDQHHEEAERVRLIPQRSLGGVKLD